MSLVGKVLCSQKRNVNTKVVADLSATIVYFLQVYYGNGGMKLWRPKNEKLFLPHLKVNFTLLKYVDSKCGYVS